MKFHRFFRGVWRINSVLILIATIAIALLAGTFAVQEVRSMLARRSDHEQAIRVVAPNDSLRLSLSRAAFIDGTNVLRAELRSFGEEGKYSSGSSSELRNFLYIEPGQKAGRWLLPNNEQVISDTFDLKNDTDADKKQVIATVLLIKPPDDAENSSDGKILLLDPAARKVSEIADRVRDIQIASLSGTELTILFEREKKLVHVNLDPRTFAKLSEQEIEIPELK